MMGGLNNTSGPRKKRQWCPECGQYVQAARPKANNLLINLLLSVLTMGIWLIVWACTADLAAKKSPKCPSCGTRTQEMVGCGAPDEFDSPQEVKDERK
jgi:ribosomal protein S27AE